MALFLFPANSFGHKASSPSGVLAFVIYQGSIAVKIKERSISLCKNHARTAIIRCSVPTRHCWIIMRSRQRTAAGSAARSLTCRWNLSASPRLSSVTYQHNSYLYGRLDEDLKQYILIHIALNISKFKIRVKCRFQDIRSRHFLKFSCLRVCGTKKLSVFTGVRTSPVLTCSLRIEQSGTGTFQLRRAPIRLFGIQKHE